MKRTRPTDIKALLLERDIRPSRVLGQNFLIDENILNILLDSAHIADTDQVLEIGPGLGVLTEPLLARAGRLLAIEKDPRLAAYIRETFASNPRFSLIEADALELDLPGLLKEHRITHVISNLPYSAGTRILLTLFDAPERPWRVVVTLQLDVAERLIAMPGSRTYGVASILAQLHYEVRIRKIVRPTCFYPVPEVRSAIIECYRRSEPLPALHSKPHFDELVKWCFSQRRKQMGRILQHAPETVVPSGADREVLLTAAEIAPEQRPESVPIVHWIALSNALRLIFPREMVII